MRRSLMKNGLRPITGLALDGEFNWVLQFQNVIKHVFEHKNTVSDCKTWYKLGLTLWGQELSPWNYGNLVLIHWDRE